LGFQKAGAVFPYFLCVFAPFRALRETKKCLRGWAFRKARSAFPYFLFLVFYSTFPCVFAPLRALHETKKVQEVGKSLLPMLVFSPITKVVEDCLERLKF